MEVKRFGVVEESYASGKYLLEIELETNSNGNVISITPERLRSYVGEAYVDKLCKWRPNEFGIEHETGKYLYAAAVNDQYRMVKDLEGQEYDLTQIGSSMYHIGLRIYDPSLQNWIKIDDTHTLFIGSEENGDKKKFVGFRINLAIFMYGFVTQEAQEEFEKQQDVNEPKMIQQLEQMRESAEETHTEAAKAEAEVEEDGAADDDIEREEKRLRGSAQETHTNKAEAGTEVEEKADDDDNDSSISI